MQRIVGRLSPLFPVLLLLSSPSTAAVLRVKTDALGAGHDGSTWETAFDTLPGAVAAADAGDEVWVAEGTYAGQLTMAAGVSLYGGFSGTETRREERDPAMQVTTLRPAVADSAPSVVVVPPGITPASVLDGFTVTGGGGVVRNGAACGGGIFCDGSSPTISNNIITGNAVSVTSAGRGGGVACLGGAPIVRGNTFRQNGPSGAPGGFAGGGVYLDASAARVEGNTFQGHPNTVTITAGSDAVVRGNTFAACEGAAITCLASAIVAENVILDATGPGIESVLAAPTIQGNVISGCRGSGIVLRLGRPVVIGNLVTGNASASAGGGIRVLSSEATVDANVVEGNTAPDGGGIWISAGKGTLVRVRGNEIRGNTAGSGGLSAAALASVGGDIEFTGNRVSWNEGLTVIHAQNDRLDFGSNRIEDNTATGIAVNSAAVLLSGAPALVHDNVVTRNGEADPNARPFATLGVAGAAAVTNNTIVNNGRTSRSYTAVWCGSGVEMVNNIVAYNAGGIQAVNGVPSLRRNIVFANRFGNFFNMPDPTGTDGNMSVDPLFVDRAGGNYRLAEGSPAINAGDDSVLLSGEQDADLGARHLGKHVDIGAYESAHANPALLADALRALRLAAGLETATPEDVTRLDTDASASLDLPDATRLLRRAVGMDIP